MPGVLPFEDTETYRFDRPDEIFLGDFVDTRFVYEIAGAPGYLHHVLETVQHVSLRNMVIDTAVWTVPAGPACPGDANGDNEVTVADLLAVVGTLGTNDPTGDVDGDGQVAVSDLLAVIGNLGVICS